MKRELYERERVSSIKHARTYRTHRHVRVKTNEMYAHTEGGRLCVRIVWSLSVRIRNVCSEDSVAKYENNAA